MSVRAKKIEALRACAAEGLTRQETADRLIVTYQTVAKLAKSHGIEFKRAGVKENDIRADAMAAMYKSGKTLEDIGGLFGLTRERVRQLITRYHGKLAAVGGQSARAAVRARKSAEEKEAACQAKHGCSLAQYRSLQRLSRKLHQQGVPLYQTPIRAFCSQRNNAKHRGIAWNLKLWDWWTIWQESGKWEERGRAGDAYVMSRFGDEGGYEIGNVYICTLRHNSSFQPNNPYRKDHPDFDKAMAAKARPGRSHIECTISGCGNRHFGQGYCNKHYYHFVTKPKKADRFEATGAAA
jgi:DNA-binding CsgD family transcriptional regulator